MIHGSQGFKILPKGFRILRNYYETHPWQDLKPWSSYYIVQTQRQLRNFFQGSWLSTLIVWSPGLKKGRGLAMSLGEEEVEHVMETCWVSSVHRSAPARAMRFLTYKVFSQKTPQVNRSSNTTNFHKKNKSPLILDKKHAPKKQKNAAKTKKNNMNPWRKFWRKIRTWPKHPQIQ